MQSWSRMDFGTGKIIFLDITQKEDMLQVEYPMLGYLPCSPHCKPEIREDNEIHNDFDFFRPVIRVQTSGWRMGSPGDER